MQNAGQIIAIDITPAVDQFILCKMHGIKMFTHPDIKNIVSTVMTADATTTTIGAKMMIDEGVMMGVIVVRTMGRTMETIEAMDQISIKVITKAKTTKVETAEVMAATKSI